VEKLHCIYEMGLGFSEKLKKITLDELKQKLSKSQEIARRYINYQIDEVNKYSPKELLISFFGRPIVVILKKQGLRVEYLKDYMKKLEDERKERREKERSKFGISQNEFPPEDDLNFTPEELFEAIFDEYKSDDDFEEKIKRNFLNKVLE
jgi:hypothetical protein